MLLRYARSQFVDPNAGSDDWAGEVSENKNFYDNDSEPVGLAYFFNLKKFRQDMLGLGPINKIIKKFLEFGLNYQISEKCSYQNTLLKIL